jgi:hypothetical protein
LGVLAADTAVEGELKDVSDSELLLVVAFAQSVVSSLLFAELRLLGWSSIEFKRKSSCPVNASRSSLRFSNPQDNCQSIM